MSQRIYMRAISHYVRRCCVVSVSAQNVSSTVASKVVNVSSKDKAKNPSPSSVIVGGGTSVEVSEEKIQSAESEPVGAPDPAGSIEALLIAAGSEFDQQSRLQELLQDFAWTDERLGEDWPSVGSLDSRSIPLLQVGGILFLPTDFVSSIIRLNRLSFSRNLNPEEKRIVLFGSDQITP